MKPKQKINFFVKLRFHRLSPQNKVVFLGLRAGQSQVVKATLLNIAISAIAMLLHNLEFVVDSKRLRSATTRMDCQASDLNCS